MKPFFYYVIDRLQERSTWAGFAMLAAGVGVHFDPTNLAKIVEIACDLIGAIYVVTKDVKFDDIKRSKVQAS